MQPCSEPHTPLSRSVATQFVLRVPLLSSVHVLDKSALYRTLMWKSQAGTTCEINRHSTRVPATNREECHGGYDLKHAQMGAGDEDRTSSRVAQTARRVCTAG